MSRSLTVGGESATKAPSAVTVEVVRDPEGLGELFETWDHLVGSGPDASVYLSRAWVEPWWRHFGAASSSSILGHTRPHILLAKVYGTPAAIIPWMEVRLPGFGRMLVGIGQETADYGGALLGDRPDVVLPALLDAIESELGRSRTIIDLTRLHPDSRFLHAIRERFEGGVRYHLAHHLSTPYPYIDLADEPGRAPDQRLRRLLKRNDVLRRERRLAENHEVTYDHHRPGRSGEDLGTFLNLHRRRWASREDIPDGLFVSTTGQAFLVDAAAALDAAGVLRISTLRADGRPIASRFGTLYGGAYQGMKSGWDPEFAPYGPGHLVVGRVLGRNLQDGIGEMDMMRGGGGHKAAWTEHRRIVSYWTLSRADRIAPLAHRAMWTALRVRARRR